MSDPQSRRTFVSTMAALLAAACGGKEATGAPSTESARPGASGGSPSTRAAADPPPSPARGPVPRRPLGKTGVTVSMLGLGGAHIGRKPDTDAAVRIMHRAIDSGLTFFDNSWDYNDGESERRMGRALEGGRREKVFLMTKIDGRTKSAAAAQIDESLKRLRTDHLDLLQIHEVIRQEDPKRVFAPGGAIEALIEARSIGKTRFIGFTGHKSPSIHLAMLKAADRHGFAFDTVQMPLNPMDPHYESFEKLVLPVLVEKGIGVLGMKSMGGGILLQSGVVEATECLRYALSLPTSVVITGIDGEEILDQALNVAASFHPMSDDEKRALLARTAKVAARGEFEKFKTSDVFDSTAHHPGWLTSKTL